MAKLYPFQVEAIKFLYRTKKALLALDMGLGKTCCCIKTAALVQAKKVLVVCPAFLIENWKREITKWNREKGIDWKIVSYNFCADDNKLKELGNNYDMLICDEAHYLRKWSAKRTKNIILKLALKIPRVIFATASPYITSAQDFHPIYSACQPGRWGKLKDFSEKFCLKKFNPWRGFKGSIDYVGVNPVNAQELKDRAKAFCAVLTKEEVLPDLPDKVVTEVPIQVASELQLESLGFSRSEASDMLLSGTLTDELAANRRKLGLTKVSAAVEFSQNVGNAQVVFFVWHRDVGQILRREINNYVPYAAQLIVGGMTNNERDSIIEHFSRGEVQFLIASIGACGVGVNLHAASIACFVEFPWSAAELEQCEDRLHRIGQKNCVNIYHLVAQNTLDDLSLDIISRKRSGAELTKVSRSL